MTVIALLNIENDPHVVADTLLSAEGHDPSQLKKVWLPALGEVSSEWTTENEGWHITRLGRKSFFLPNQSGILSFAGSCRAAFDFWSELSSSIMLVAGYNPAVKVDKAMIELALGRMQSSAMSFSMIGVLIDINGNRSAYIHNEHDRLVTKNFGTCFVSGSGKQLVIETIKQADRILNTSHEWPANYPISPTEDLAEHISTKMLYRETDEKNGKDSNTPITLYCGGFYEWYGIHSNGIRPMRSRIDLHVIFDSDNLIITRAYFVEELQLFNNMDLGCLPSQKYSISVLNLGLISYQIPVQDIPETGYQIQFDECYGTLIESVFQENSNTPRDRIYGPLDSTTLEYLFPSPHALHRIRAVVGREKESQIAKRFINDVDENAWAYLSVNNGKLVLWISHLIFEKILKTFG